MKKETIELAQHRLNRAKDTFQEGLTLLEKESLNGALNRFYYSAFYAARALLATKDLDSSKHSGVISLFHRHFVKSGTFDMEKAKALSFAFEERQDSDYEDFVSPTQSEVEKVRGQVKEFVEESQRVLATLAHIPPP